jgi:hypothetical protein
MSIEELSKSELEDLVLHFQGSTESVISNILFETIDTILKSPSLWKLLAIPKDDLVTLLEKIVHAKSVLSPELYSAIWEGSIMDSGMTYDKLRTIWIADPRINLNKFSRWGIDIEIINALWWKIIADKRTTVSKLTLFQNGATPKWISKKIEELWEEWFLNMDIPDIAVELF